MENFREVKILLVEDDPGDVELTKEVLFESKLRLKLEVAENGLQAMEYLRKQGEYKDATSPDLILLDLNMPVKGGRETLEEIKTNQKLKHIPVVILTTSDSNLDIIKSYTAGANCYVSKPVDLSEFQKIVSAIENFWFSIVKLPENENI